MKPYIRKFGLRFALAFLLVMAEAACDLLLPTMLAHLINGGVTGGHRDVVIKYGSYMAAITAVGALSALGRNWISSRVSQQFGADLRGDLFRHIQKLSLPQLDRFERASLVTRLTNDITQVQNFVNGMMRIFAKAPMLCIGALIMAIRLNSHLSLVLAVVVVIVAVLIWLNLKTGYPLFLKVQTELDRLNGVMREYLSGVRAVKAFNRFDYESDKFESRNQAYQDRSIATLRTMAAFSPGIGLAVNLGIVAIIWIGGVRVNAGQMQVGDIVAFVNYMTQILFALLVISWVFTMFVRARASFGRIYEVLEVPVLDHAVTGDRSVTLDTSMSKQRTPVAKAAVQKVAENGAEQGHREELSGLQQTRPILEFDRIGFSYEGLSGERVLHDITLTVQRGETIGIVGSTGSGKSTLVHLVPRLYDPSEGIFRIDGVDSRRLNPIDVRNRISIVPQKTILFSGTIRDNILWGNELATGSEVEDAARMAAADAFIQSFEDGYETVLGQGGVNLSGGQKQRLSIARALVRKPDILILDDCTSALDAVTEASIKNALRRYSSGLTCLLIAQRLSSVSDADRIVVMDEGTIVGVGTHEELLRNCSVYQEIYRSQSGQGGGRHAAGI